MAGVLRAAVDNCIAALQGATVRNAVRVADLPVLDAAIANLTTARVAVPQNDLLANLTPAQRRALDQQLSAIFLTFDLGDGTSIDSRSGLPPEAFYNFLDGVCDIRDACRAGA